MRSFAQRNVHPLIVLLGTARPRLGDLQAELELASLRIEVAESLAAPDFIAARASAVVCRADDFPSLVVLQAMKRLRARRPGLRILLLTSWPDALELLLGQVTIVPGAAILRDPPSLRELLSALGVDRGREGALRELQ